MKNNRILILGASGMLGNALFRWFALDPDFEVYGTVRGFLNITEFKRNKISGKLFTGIDVGSYDSLVKVFSNVNPGVVINCVGVVKQLSQADDPLIAIPVNSLLPHRLAHLAQVSNSRLIHMSTDCVFSGNKGCYCESDTPDAVDFYGRSKLLGEVDYPNAITLRTSIIGHELSGARSLVDWFLSQKNEVRGYKKAIFSGFPTVEIARIIREYVMPNTQLHGLYHLSADPINKFDLLSIVAKVYKKDIKIIPDEKYIIDRSLNSNRFRLVTGFTPQPWEYMVELMQNFR